LNPGFDGRVENNNPPQLPGGVLELIGHAADDAGETVFIALMKDKDTYRALADNPAQDAWYRRFTELIEGDVRWEDVELDIAVQNQCNRIGPRRFP
jgi:hypothetical protein